MSEFHDVRRRIQKRRFEEPKKHSTIFKMIYRTMMLAMVVAVLTLGFFINDKMGLVQIPESLSKLNFALISEWIPFENWFGMKEETVNAVPPYSLLKENQYANGSNQANAILDGVVQHVEARDDKLSSVTIRHDNGVIATYGHLKSVGVKSDERILKGAVLGSFMDYVNIDLRKDNINIDLSTALSGT